jgi:hypothetical protein
MRVERVRPDLRARRIPASGLRIGICDEEEEIERLHVDPQQSLGVDICERKRVAQDQERLGSRELTASVKPEVVKGRLFEALLPERRQLDARTRGVARGSESTKAARVDGLRGLSRLSSRAFASPTFWSASIAGAGFEPATFGL